MSPKHDSSEDLAKGQVGTTFNIKLTDMHILIGGRVISPFEDDGRVSLTQAQPTTHFNQGGYLVCGGVTSKTKRRRSKTKRTYHKEQR